jgi:hypothetical protein
VFFRLFLLAIIVFFLFRAVRSRLLRRTMRVGAAGTNRDLGVDPETIKDAEFTEVSDTEEGGK